MVCPTKFFPVVFRNRQLLTILFCCLFSTSIQQINDIKQQSDVEFAEIHALIENINDANELGDTYLMQVAKTGRLEAVKNYIKSGADVNMVNEVNNYTAIQYAVERGHYFTTVELINAGAVLNRKDKNGLSPYLLAVRRGLHEVIRVLLISERVDVNEALPSGQTALMMAVQQGLFNTTQLLLQYHADVNKITKSKESALMYASVIGHYELSKLLLENGAYVDQTNEDGLTSLMFASSRGYESIVELLLKHGSNINLRNLVDQTAFDLAVKHGHKMVANILYANGAITSRRQEIHLEPWALERRRQLHH
jgi:ankyrin repeat protein